MNSQITRHIKSPIYLGLTFTVVIFLGFELLPKKRVALHPVEGNVPNLYGFVDTETGDSAYWVDEEQGEWRCEYKPAHRYGCGWYIYWDPANNEGLDMTAFDALEITMDYQGPASRIRLYMRNYNDAYADPGNARSTKFMAMTFPVAEAKQPVLIDLSELTVAAWWLSEENIRRHWSQPEFNHITQIGIDLVEVGTHSGRIHSLFLVGEWIKKETMIFIILAFWMTMFLLEGVTKFFQLYRKTQSDRYMIRVLEDKRHKLEEEKSSLGALADTDPLTGVYNRSGLETHLNRIFGESKRAASTVDLGIILLDIDHFKLLNDAYGHDMGDKVLKAFSAAMSANLREEDIFARWGGEEFIVICQNRSVNSLYGFAEKLRRITTGYSFGADVEVTISISLGITMVHQEESFTEAFKRADRALYKAKEAGRNRVEYEQRS